MAFPQWPISGERERALINEVLSSERWGGYHPIVSEFEKRFAEFQHCAFGLAAMNGTVTLEMALAALGVAAATACHSKSHPTPANLSDTRIPV